MHAHILGYSQGWRWIADGFALWRRAPALTSYVSFAYVLILLLASSLPYLGQLIGFDDLGSYAFGTIQAAGTGVQPLQVVVMVVISFVVFTIGRRLFEARDVK